MLRLYKNKGEIFKCQFQIEGASLDNTKVRLCLEFDDNKNLFFYGKINNEGQCVIEIPKLKEMDNKDGSLIIEAIADDTYFKVYESQVELRNSVEVKMTQTESTMFEKKIKGTNIKLESVIQQGLVETSPETKEEIVDDIIKLKKESIKPVKKKKKRKAMKTPLVENKAEAITPIKPVVNLNNKYLPSYDELAKKFDQPQSIVEEKSKHKLKSFSDFRKQ